MKFSTTKIKPQQFQGEPIRAIQSFAPDQIIVVYPHRAALINLAGETLADWKLPQEIDSDLLLDVYCSQNYVAIVESKGLNGVVVSTKHDDWRMKLAREDYHCNNCTWTIGFVRRQEQTVLIHATQWNRIDFTELPTRKCLTEREVDYKKELNYLDYFHSSLYLSPDKKHFVVNGWVWSPYDVLYCWNIERFIKEYEPSVTDLSQLDHNGYNWDRPCCFIDNQTIAWGYNEREAGNPGVPDDQVTELIFQNIQSTEIVRRMPFEYFDLSSEKEAYGRLWYDEKQKIFICASNRGGTSDTQNKKRGTTVVDDAGNELHHWPRTADFVSIENQCLGFAGLGEFEIIQFETDL